ncbi:MAG: helix-turn-helix transcriptional regulator [Clostridia bacterium]|nr:helix-turn-helix transcriptional regulator [Clostridia bacterium]
MEFNEKLQELRKQKGITQEELADCLYVSRTAISKWESGRGYPNIESLKAIARFFGVTVDALLSGEELLTVAEEDTKRKETHLRDLIYGLLDLSIAMLLFLPLFATKANGVIQSASLIALDGIRLYLKIAYFIAVGGMIAIGVLMLALQNYRAKAWMKSKTTVSLILGVILSLLFIISAQPYAALFAFTLLTVKVFLLIKRS